MIKKDYLVSAIVSVYNCERFIAGCLEDLEQQTIADKIEIVVVNSGSQQNEEPIIKKFQEKYDNIVYIKTDNRETIYQAWNRGIQASSGKYITNANSDDRHRKDALEIMANVLENEANIGFVYADHIRTHNENETFENCTPAKYINQPEFDYFQFLQMYFIGPQPMWRKNIHKEFGYFNKNLRVAGDYDFFLRISEKNKCKHVGEYLGLYLINPKSAERGNFDITILETEEIRNKYLTAIAHDKKKVKVIMKIQSNNLFSLGYFFFQHGQLYLTRQVLCRSIIYSWYNFQCYKLLIATLVPSKLIQIIKKK